MTAMNGGKPQARELIERLMASERVRSSSHFSQRVYASEPILTTGRQMASYLPDKYREMRSISRWEEGEGGRPGRWLSESELFFRQGTFMAAWEDDCPYHGTFKSFFPTYNAMSDRQLRGYFTWRAAVRSGRVEETSLSFAYVYMYELINGIGVDGPHDGFTKLKTFWETYRAFSPEIDRYAEPWLIDYAVYHGLPASLLEHSRTVEFDRSLIALRHAEARSLGIPLPPCEGHAALEAYPVYRGIDIAENGAVRAMWKNPAATESAALPALPARRRKRGESAMPLPADAALEDELLAAIDALSTHRLTTSRLYKHEPEALRHVACAVFVRMSEYHRKHRQCTLLESWFGEEVALGHAMFNSAVFFETAPHADATYELDEVHRYECRQGQWLCRRFHGSRSKSSKLGALMRAIDRSLRRAIGFEHPLKKDDKTPKYVQKFIDDEVAIWLEWRTTHAPRRIEIQLDRLAGIRATAALTRESLLIDEERMGEGALLDAAAGVNGPDSASAAETMHPADSERKHASEAVGPSPEEAIPGEAPVAREQPGTAQGPTAADLHPSSRGGDALGTAGAETDGNADTIDSWELGSGYAPEPGSRAAGLEPRSAVPGMATKPMAPNPTGTALPTAARSYLTALLEGDGAARAAALQADGRSEDLLVDAINEALFDLLGDTAIEYGADGPAIIDDYRDDIEELLNHA